MGTRDAICFSLFGCVQKQEVSQLNTDWCVGKGKTVTVYPINQTNNKIESR